MTLLILHEALAGALLYTVFCRAVRTCSNSTRTDVLIALWLLGIVAIVMMAAPIVFGWNPDVFNTALLAAVVTLQWVTSKHWRDGVPASFRKPQHAYCRPVESNSDPVSGQTAQGGKVVHRLRS